MTWPGSETNQLDLKFFNYCSFICLCSNQQRLGGYYHCSTGVSNAIRNIPCSTTISMAVESLDNSSPRCSGAAAFESRFDRKRQASNLGAVFGSDTTESYKERKLFH